MNIHFSDERDKKEFELFAELAIQLKRGGKSDTEILQNLRREGASIGKSILVFRTVLNMPANDAKTFVQNSAVWADGKESNDNFHNSLWALFENEGLKEE